MEEHTYVGKIVFHANQLKIIHGTNDPFEIAEKQGIRVVVVDEKIDVLKARTDYIGNTAYIKINSKYSEEGRKMLCAHELGHVIFHPRQKHEYKDRNAGYYDLRAEHEANLFALSLMFERGFFEKPIFAMDEYEAQAKFDRYIS